MSLINCPDCGRQVSDSAPNCPQCGRPMSMFSGKSVQTRRKGGKYEGIGFLLIVGGMFACFASGVLGGLLILIGFIIFLIGRFM